MSAKPRIALLSTGDELINGNIVNTNSQSIAEQLFAVDIQPGLHATASDEQADIEAALRFLLADHAGLIITGGLGPTSDDRTRFALAQVINQPLIFDESCWQNIIQRLQRLNLPIPDSNRQQCLFPTDAAIFKNNNGTAAACRVMYNEKPIFMLPGPPFECMPIFKEHVLPYLQSHGFSQPLHRCEWLLSGVSEGSIAALLDPLMENTGCTVGYRLHPPYLEVKLQSSDESSLIKTRDQFETLIGSQSISSHKQKASAQLVEFILKRKQTILISDQATGGLLAATLLTPEVYPYLRFTPSNFDDFLGIKIEIRGLEHYWQKQTIENCISVTLHATDQNYHLKIKVPYRQTRTLLYAAESICWEVLNCLDRAALAEDKGYQNYP